MGPRKLIPWSQFEGVCRSRKPLHQKLSTSPSFKSMRHRHVKKKSSSDPKAVSDANRQEQDHDSENEEASLLFPCPEEGCVKRYRRFVSLQAHL